MMRRILALIGALALVALAAAPFASAQADGLVLEQLDVGSYPLVRAVVSGPSVSGLLDEAFTVVEDGEPVVLDVVRLRGDDLHVMVAVDESGSMNGEPIEAAKAAVVELATALPEGARIGLLGFGDEVRILEDFTADRGTIEAATGRLFAFGETALYDGVSTSLDALEAAGGSSALVVLSDGKDTKSLATLEYVSARLESTDILTSIVTLETADFDSTVASLLAQAADGEVIPVSQTADLTGAFQQVASGLGNLYELRWRSRSVASVSEVTISLTDSPSVAATTSFPHEPTVEYVPDVADATVVVGSADGVTSAPWIPVAGGLGVSAGVVLLLALFRSSASATRRREIREADLAFAEAQKPTPVSGLANRLTLLSTSLLESSGRSVTLDEKLERAGLSVASGEVIVFTAATSVIAAAVGGVVVGYPGGFAFVVIPIVLMPLVLKFLISRRRKAFVEQLGDTLQMMAGSLTAGYGLGQTLDAIAREAASPTSDEFARVVMETRLGRSVEDALDAMSLRIMSPDFDWVVDAIKIQSSVGGNLSEIIAQVGETIRARNRVRRQVDALTAEGKISALVLFTLPFGLTFFISMSNPAYVAPLFGTKAGWAMLAVAGFLMTAGGVWLKKLVNPEF